MAASVDSSAGKPACAPENCVRPATDAEAAVWRAHFGEKEATSEVLVCGDPVRMALLADENGSAALWAAHHRDFEPATVRALSEAVGRPLTLAEWIEDGSGPADVLRAAGWTVAETTTLWETRVESLRVAKADRLREALEHRARLPAGLRLAPLAPADAGAVVDLVSRHLPPGSLPVVERLRMGGVAGFSAKLSRVLWVDGMCRGAILSTWQGTLATIDLVVVDHGLRRGWANLLLKQSLRVPLAELGVEAVRFWVNPAVNTDSLKAAWLSGAVVRHTRHRFAFNALTHD